MSWSPRCSSPEPRSPTSGSGTSGLAAEEHFSLQGLCGLVPALEHLEAPGSFLVELGPKNLLLAEPWDYSASRALCLLPWNFGLICSWPLETLSAHEPQLGCLLSLLLGSVPLATPWLLAAQLAGVQPSAALTCFALQALLWGPGPRWAAPCCYCGTDPMGETCLFQGLYKRQALLPRLGLLAVSPQ
ncbi:protein PEAK3 isoform X2 [Phyllostomus hastatus]|uniref:protein PEAK3 isoform X2 n=1 Tax=Phyllostomus hastatus TaxID=9423 RepID=UPI001E67F9D8|nr:protein PEAK3 isoform X2 [Phyllostomus hastatus]